MLLPIHVNCAKQKEVKVLNRISFFSTAEPIEGLRMRAAGSTKGTIHAVCPLLNIIGEANRKAEGTTSSASAPFKRSAFLSSYHHRQRRRKDSGTQDTRQLQRISNSLKNLSSLTSMWFFKKNPSNLRGRGSAKFGNPFAKHGVQCVRTTRPLAGAVPRS